MINVRHGVFETNSSSVHTLVLCTEDQYKQMEQGKVLLDYQGRHYTINEAINLVEKRINANPKIYDQEEIDFIKNINDKSENQIITWLKDHESFFTLEDYLDNEYYETFKTEMTTPGGEKVIAFGFYGQNY